MRAYVIYLFLLFPGLSSVAQNKLEREERIKSSQLPKEIAEIIKPFLSEARNIRYYYETDGTHKSYEVKFLLKADRYSVEFSDQLELEDVEVIIQMQSIQTEVYENIINYFQQHDKFKIRKVQKQFSSDTAAANSVIEGAIANTNQLTVRYEIIADLKQGKSWEQQEVLFDSEGAFVSSRKVIKRAEDFILYR